MEVHLYGKRECGKCQSTKRMVEHFAAKYANGRAIAVRYVDMDSIEGMAEGAFRDVFDVPTTIVTEGGQDLARWVGVVPESEDLKAHFVGKA